MVISNNHQQITHINQIHKVVRNVQVNTPLNTDEFIIRANEKHDFSYDYSKVIYKNSISNVVIICQFHGEYTLSPNKHLSGRGCQKCRLPKGEQKVLKVLNQLNVKFEHQHFFSDCKNINPLPFDFYIKIEEYQFLIEFNGEQHYRPVKFGGLNDNNANNRFEELKKRDEVKKEYAFKNGIPLLIIRYDETDKIFEQIKEFLKL